MPEYTVVGLNYNSSNPDDDYDFLSKQVKASLDYYKPDVYGILGTSLGGFWAMKLAGSGKCVIINPSLKPYITLKNYVGMNVNNVTKCAFNITEEDVTRYILYKVMPSNLDALVLLDKNDELFDSGCTKTYFENYNKHVIMYEGGSHVFEHLKESIGAIIEHIEGG